VNARSELATGRNPAFDLMRAAAVLSLFHLAFFSGYVESGFGLADAATAGGVASLFARVAVRGALTLMSLGLCAFDLFFVLSGFCCFEAVLSGGKSAAGLAVRRYLRFAPLYAMAAIPVFAYSEVAPADMIAHLLALDGGPFGSFLFGVTGKANYPYLFGLLCAVFALPGLSKAMKPPLAPLWLLGLLAALVWWILSGRAPSFLNFHACAFFLGAMTAAVHARFPASRLVPAKRARLAAAIIALAALCLWSWRLWTHRADEFLPLATGTGAQTLAVALFTQALCALAVYLLAGTPPRGTTSPASPAYPVLRALTGLGAASLSFFLAFALYGLTIGDLPLPGLAPFAAMAARYGASLGASLVLCLFFHRFFEGFSGGKRPAA